MPTWSYLVADLRTSTIIGDLPLTGVRMSKVLNGSGQMQATLNLGDPKVQVLSIYDLTAPVRRVIYAVRDNRPWWGGIIWARDYDSDTKQVTVGLADFWSYFDHRKVLPILAAAPFAAKTYVARRTTVYTQLDQNTIARNLVTLAQSHTAGNIGITFDTGLSGILRDRAYEGYDLIDTGEALRNLAEVISGPDVLFDVGEFDSAGKPRRLMRTGTPQLGQMGSDHRFDVGGNCLSYKWSSGGGGMATRVFAEGEGGDERAAIIAGAEDTSLYTTGWPLVETDESFAGVTNYTTLQQHADTLLAALRLPVLTINLAVRPNLAPNLGEIGMGDDARLVIPKGDLFRPEGLDLPIRLVGVEVTVDDSGDEQVTLACASLQEMV